MAFFSFLSSWYLNVLHICSTVKGPLMAQLPRRCRLESTNKIAYSFPQGWWTGRLHTTAAMWCFSVQGYSEEILPSTSQHSNHRKKMAISFKFLKVPRQSAQPHIYRLLHLPSYLSQIPPQFFRKLKHIPKKTPKNTNAFKLLYFELSPPWHLYVLLLANLLAFYLTYLLAFYLAYLLAFYLAYLLAFYLAYLLQYVLAYLLALYLAYLLAYLLTFYLAYLLAFYLAVEVQRCTLSWEGPRLRSSGAHWAGKVPGWGPAVRAELGRSQVEV